MTRLCLAAYAGEVREFAAQYVNGEQATTLDPSSGGQPIYQGTVFVPADVDILESQFRRPAISSMAASQSRIRFG